MEAGIIWSILMIISFFLQAADTVLKVQSFPLGTSDSLILSFSLTECLTVYRKQYFWMLLED